VSCIRVNIREHFLWTEALLSGHATSKSAFLTLPV